MSQTSSLNDWVNADDVDPENERFVETLPSNKQRLGWFTIMCLILNRSIGTGIFATPSKVIIGTGNVGPSLVMWVFGGIIALAGLQVWNELGLSVPRKDGKSVPRSGGEKNFFEYMVKSPRFLVTCMYGIIYLILGNLSGNAIQLGVYVMTAAGHDNPSKGPVLAIAIAALTIAVLVHVFSRRGGIVLNNAFAVFKVSLLVVIIILGILRRSGLDLGGGNSQNKNFEKPFTGASNSVANYVDSFIYIFYSFSGFKQPFYALGEAKTPRRIFPWATNVAVIIQWVLFVLTNVAFLWAVDLSRIQETTKEGYSGSTDMASLFFESIFGTGSPTPKRAMTGLLAVSIMGNLIVMTFIAARVKQEIAKEGILPFSLLFAKSTPTPWARAKRRWGSKASRADAELPEQSPIAALFLHLGSSIFLIAVTAGLELESSYTFLISLYAYVINGLVGFLSSGGLLYLKYLRADEWRTVSVFTDSKLGRSRWTNSIPAWFYCLFTGFLLFASFVPPPADDRGYTSSRAGIPWYIVPTIGLTSLLWGLIWYGGLKAEERRRGEVLIIDRDPTIREFHSRDRRHTEWIMTSEIITRRWRTRGFNGEDIPIP